MRSYHIFNTLTRIYIPPPTSTNPLLLSGNRAATHAASCSLGNQLSCSLLAWPPSLVGQNHNAKLPPEPGPNLPAFTVCQGPSWRPRSHLGGSFPWDRSSDTPPSVRLTSGELWSYCLWAINLWPFCSANDRCHIVWHVHDTLRIRVERRLARGEEIEAGKKKRGRREEKGRGQRFVPPRAVKAAVIPFSPSIVPRAHKSDITLRSRWQTVMRNVNSNSTALCLQHHADC